MDFGPWSTELSMVSVCERPRWLSPVWARLRPSLVWERLRLPSFVCDLLRLPSNEVTLDPDAVRERTRRVMLAAGTERKRKAVRYILGLF